MDILMSLDGNKYKYMSNTKMTSSLLKRTNAVVILGVFYLKYNED